MKRSLLSSLLFAACLFALGQPSLRAQVAGAEAAAKYEAAGNQLYQANDFTQAVRYYQAALQMDPSRKAAYVGLGNCHYRLGNKTAALEAYDKALALDPSNAQLAQFVNALRGSETSVAQTVDPMRQATELFTQKRYAEAIPLFEQAAKANPSDPKAQYYWAYACAMSGDRRGAALHFYRYNALAPNPGVQAYADKVKASLSPEDQAWLDTQLSGGATAGAGVKSKPKKFSLRLGPTLVLSSQKDLDAYAKAVTTAVGEAQTLDPTLSVSVEAPKGYLMMGLEPTYLVSPNLEVGLSLGYYFVKDMVIDVAGEGYNSRTTIGFGTMDVGLCGRFNLGKPGKKTRPFVDLGVRFVSVSTSLEEKAVYLTDPDRNRELSKDGSAAGIGGQLRVGLDYAMSPSVHISPTLGYKFLKAKDVLEGQVETATGTVPYPCGLDLGGPMAGILIAAYF